MTIERRQVKEALLLNKQNKEMQRFESFFKVFASHLRSHRFFLKSCQIERSRTFTSRRISC